MSAQRRAAAVAAVGLGVLDLTLAAARRAPLEGPEVFGLPIEAVHGARYSLLLLGLGLLWAGRGLAWGQRTTWKLALICAAVSVPALGVKRFDLLGVAAASAVVVLLVLTRRAFTAPADPVLARRGFRLLLAGEVTTFVYGSAGLYLLDAELTSSTELAESAVNAARRMVLQPVEGLSAASRHGTWFLTSIPLLSLSVAAVAGGMMLRPLVAGPSRRRSEERMVREILTGWGTSSLAHFHLLGDKRYLFSRDRTGFVGYKVVGRVALALGEPIGPPAARQAVARDFVDLCQRNGWLPAFHQVTDEGAAELGASAGIRRLKIGEEAVVDVAGFSLEGSRHKSLRSAIRRVEKAGLQVVELPAPLSDDDIADLRGVSDAWMADGGHRERTFTLGRFDADQLRATTVLALRNDAGATMAFVNVLPAYRSDGGNFDLMRRRPDSPNGTMDLLFVKLIERFRAEGRTGMSLGLAPLSGIVGDGPAERALRLLSEHGGRAFNFAGLRTFKEKWDPTWEPRFLGYRREADLPRVALALARAGELDDPASMRRRVAALAQRLPASGGLLSVVVALMLASVWRPVFHTRLLDDFGLRYDDLLNGELWRLLTSPLLQTRPGVLWGNIALLAVAVPAAELRLGWRRTLAACFAADITSTLAALAVLRVAAASNNPSAATALSTADAGSSSLAWGAAAALAVSLPTRRLRLAVGGAMTFWLIVAVAVHHRIYDGQHLLAAPVGAGLIIAWRRGWFTAPARRRPTQASGGETFPPSAACSHVGGDGERGQGAGAVGPAAPPTQSGRDVHALRS